MNALQQQQFEEDIKRLDGLHRHYNILNTWSEKEKEEIKNILTYHSNKIEGLQLTYGDTISFLKDKIIKPGSRAKDISDLKNYKTILDLIFNSYDSLELTEDTIKKLHAELMQDPSQWDVIDPLQAGPGEYKTENNYVFRPGGDHTYLDYSLVANAMKELVNSLSKQIKEQKTHTIKFIAQSHFEFLRIHPFTDGNGRMARLISTLLLLKTNYPPLIIEADEKEKYFEALIKSETQPEQEAIVHFFIKKMILNLSKNVNKRKSRLRK